MLKIFQKKFFYIKNVTLIFETPYIFDIINIIINQLII